MNGENEVSAEYLEPNNVGDPDWKIVGSADFNGDGQPDLLFQRQNGMLGVWLMDGDKLSKPMLLKPDKPSDPDWRVVAVGDLDGDGKPDLIFQYRGGQDNGRLATWLMDGVSLVAPKLLDPDSPGDPSWRVVASGDFNKDGKLDLVFQHADGTLGIWYMDGVNLAQPLLLKPSHPGDAEWRVVGAADLDGDGQPTCSSSTNGQARWASGS